jgi:hypothetical protein
VQLDPTVAVQDKVIEEVLGVARTGVATTGAELAVTVDNALLTADIGLLPAGSVHKACTVNE